MIKCLLKTYLEPSSVCLASSQDWEAVLVTGLSADSRRLQTQGAFFVLHGASQSSELFIHEVLAKRPAAILVPDHDTYERVRDLVSSQETIASIGTRPVVLFVKDLRAAFLQGLRTFWGCPDESLTLIGVTGTNGKSSVAWILAELFARMSHSARGAEIWGIPASCGAFYVGTLGKVIYTSEVARDSTGELINGSSIGSSSESYRDLSVFAGELRKEVLPTCNTTPGPEELWEFFAAMKSRGLRYGVLEVSSHAMHQGRTTGVNWDAAIFTNFTRDHLDYHRSEEEYLKAKERLFTEELLASTKPRKIAVFNRSDIAVRTVGERFQASLAASDAERVVCCHFNDLSDDFPGDLTGAHPGEPVLSDKPVIPCDAPEHLAGECIAGDDLASRAAVVAASDVRYPNCRDANVHEALELDVQSCYCREDGIAMQLMLRRSTGGSILGVGLGESDGCGHSIVAASTASESRVPVAVQSPLVGRYNATNLLTALTCALNLWELEWSAAESSAFESLLGESLVEMLPVERLPANVSLSAAGVSQSTRVLLDRLRCTFSQLSRVPGRFELFTVGREQDRRYVVVDYAHTPDALDRVQRSIREMFSQRLVTVFGSGGDRDRGKRPLMGAAVGRHSDMAIVTNDNPRGENPDDIANDIIAGFPPDFAWRKELDRGAAIDLAIRLAKPGDVVLIAGKGHEDYQEERGERNAFSDSRYVSQMSFD